MKAMSRLSLALVILAIIRAYFSSDLGCFHSLDYFKAQQAAIETWRTANPLIAVGVFSLIYIAVTA